MTTWSRVGATCMAMASLSRRQRTHSHDATACRYFGRAVAGACISSRLGRRGGKQKANTQQINAGAIRADRRGKTCLRSKTHFARPDDSRRFIAAVAAVVKGSPGLARLPIPIQASRVVFSLDRNAYHVDLPARIPRTMNIPMRFVVSGADSPHAKYRSRRVSRTRRRNC